MSPTSKEELQVTYPVVSNAIEAFNILVDSLPLNIFQRERLKNANTRCMTAYGDAVDTMLNKAKEKFPDK